VLVANLQMTPRFCAALAVYFRATSELLTPLSESNPSGAAAAQYSFDSRFIVKTGGKSAGQGFTNDGHCVVDVCAIPTRPDYSTSTARG
jgi:hypothetical protein